MINEFKKNIEIEIAILREMKEYSKKILLVQGEERTLLSKTLESLKNRMKMINASIPVLLQQIGMIQKLPSYNEKDTNLERIEIRTKEGQTRIILDKRFREQFIRELRISEENLKKIGKTEKIVDTKEEGYKKPRGYLKIANKIFVPISRKLIQKGYYGQLDRDLKQANMQILTEGYVSIIFLNTILSLILGVFLWIFFIFFNFSFSSGITPFEGDMILRTAKMIFIPIILVFATFLISYLYPKTERGDIERRLNQELPFAVVYMSAIAGSGIEPSAIFKIISVSNEYPYLRKEIRKVLNQINIYGYDLITALNNVSKNAPSKKLGDLFSGLATTITSGGSMTEFFQKRAESLVNDYRLEREKFSKSAETSMDLYITVVIAAPMILLLIFILLTIGDFFVSMSPAYLTFLIIGGIAIINVLFLAIIHFKQPQY